MILMILIVRTDTNKGKKDSENREDRKYPSELQIVLFLGIVIIAHGHLGNYL